jgi:hypothetical protein
MTSKLPKEVANLETLPNGRRFLRSVQYPKPENGWIVEAETETLADGRFFLRHAPNPDYGFIVEQKTIDGKRQMVPIDYIRRPR